MSKKLKRTDLFAKDVGSLLYAYGDVAQPLPETVQCLDELVSGYLVDVCSAAYRTAQGSRRSKLKLEDFKFAIRRDAIKLGRAEELIATNKLITEAKRQFNGTDNQNLKRFREGEEDDEYQDGDMDNEEDIETVEAATTSSGKTSKQKSTKGKHSKKSKQQQ